MRGVLIRLRSRSQRELVHVLFVDNEEWYPLTEDSVRDLGLKEITPLHIQLLNPFHKTITLKIILNYTILRYKKILYSTLWVRSIV